MAAKTQKFAWWKISGGKMDRRMQEAFERGQKVAQETGKPAQITLTIAVAPPKKDESEYMPIAFKIAFKEPSYTSGNSDVVLRNGVAVADAEQHPDQTILELEPSEFEKAKERAAV
jgi:hypothetical protein